ncbi:MAG TPA: hypothetical protein VHT05_04815 [Candidatus Elarobacter sp.]|nr:hypothetical protein [Candidatus Elarobacter sp.]
MTIVLEPADPSPRRAPDGEVAGAVLAIAALASIFVLAHHPTGGHRQVAALVAEIVRFAPQDQAVHGAMIALVAGLLFALTVFSLRRGLRDQLVLAALIAYAIGVLALTGAALVDGFIVPSVSAAYATDVSTAAAEAVALLRLCFAAIQAATGLGLVAQSVAIVLWSAGLVRSAGWTRVVGVLGLPAALYPPALLAMHGAITAHMLVGLVAAQAIWYLGVAVLLLRRDV